MRHDFLTEDLIQAHRTDARTLLVVFASHRLYVTNATGVLSEDPWSLVL